MAALNARLEKPVTVDWLRHNFVVRTLTDEPYQEDGWTGLVRWVMYDSDASSFPVQSMQRQLVSLWTDVYDISYRQNIKKGLVFVDIKLFIIFILLEARCMDMFTFLADFSY